MTTQAYVLYAFDRVVNLLNQDGDVLSLAAHEVGNGPFSLVLEKGAFPSGVKIESKLLVFENGLWLDDWLVDTEGAEVWQPKADWKAVRSANPDLLWAATAITELLTTDAAEDSLARLVIDPLGNSPLPARILQAAEQHIPLLHSAVLARNKSDLRIAVKGLAGLGPGLTPAGDDFLVGTMHALWARTRRRRGKSL